MKGLTLVKYEGTGNDFLVLVEPGGDVVASPELARVLCDRHRGPGADGLLVLGRGTGPASITMTLFNADGSTAETSGNGLRCAVLAAMHAGLFAGESVAVRTDAGEMWGEVTELTGAGSAKVRVTMGQLQVTRAEHSPLGEAQAFDVDAGNPHLVLIGEQFAGVDLAVLGPVLSSAVAGGRNVELVSPTSLADCLDLVVYERGVGITEACGTGSCAGAAAARLAGLVGECVVVRNPGGPLLVELSGALASPLAKLSGSARRVATIVVELDDLDLDEMGSR